MILIIDDLLSPSYADAIERDSLELSYLYKEYTSVPEYGQKLYKDDHTHDFGQFVCPIVHRDAKMPSEWYYPSLKPLLYTVSDKANFLIKDVLRIKFNMIMNRSGVPEYHYTTPHYDERSGYSMIYYINDSDGDTYLFNEFITESNNIPKNLTVAKRISPRKNRVVIFESNRYHASSNPTCSKIRSIINFVLEIENANNR
jgi:hypothetical protein